MKLSKRLLFVAISFFAVIASCSKSSDNSVKPPTPDPTPPAPVLTMTGFTPLTAQPGATITITGTAFGANATLVTVKFGTGSNAIPITISDTQLTVILPADATTGQITITVNGINYVQSGREFGVDKPTPPVTSIDYTDYNQISYTGTAALSEARAWLAAAGTGDKILFAGGSTISSNSLNPPSSGYSNTVDIYNTTTNTWTVSHLSEARACLAGAAAGNKVVFAGGTIVSGSRVTCSKTVDIYDITTNTWTTANLSLARTMLTATSSGNKIFFAGGRLDIGNTSDVIDVYDVVENKWSTIKLASPAERLASASADGKVAFWGGAPYGTGDVFMVASLIRDPIRISGSTQTCKGAGSHERMVFSGDGSIANIFNTRNNLWSTATFSTKKYDCASAFGGTKILFAGGINSFDALSAVDIYDSVTDSWSTLQLSQARSILAGASAANKILFAGGTTNQLSATAVSNRVDIFTLTKQ